MSQALFNKGRLNYFEITLINCKLLDEAISFISTELEVIRYSHTLHLHRMHIKASNKVNP